MKPDARNEASPRDSTTLEEWELCPHCLMQNVPDTNFCPHCGSPLSPYAAIGPWERLLAQGHIYRTAAEHPHRLIVVLGIWLIFIPTVFLGMGIPFWMTGGGTTAGWVEVLGWLFAGALAMLSLSIIVKTTRNFIMLRKRPGRSGSDA